MTVPVDTLAAAFHEAYERLAPEFGYETRAESAVPWDRVPENNRRLMEAVVAEVCGPLVARATQAEADRDTWETIADGLVSATVPYLHERMQNAEAEAARLRNDLKIAYEDHEIAEARLREERNAARSDLIYQTRESQGRERRRLAAEAEAARLREERDAANNLLEGLTVACEGWKLDCRAAEARCARLQQALRAYEVAFSQWDAQGGIYLGPPAARQWRSIAREALAGPGSEQSSLTESGSAGLPDTPADSQPEETTT